eukprot:g816.t1
MHISRPHAKGAGKNAPAAGPTLGFALSDEELEDGPELAKERVMGVLQSATRGIRPPSFSRWIRCAADLARLVVAWVLGLLDKQSTFHFAGNERAGIRVDCTMLVVVILLRPIEHFQATAAKKGANKLPAEDAHKRFYEEVDAALLLLRVDNMLLLMGLMGRTEREDAAKHSEAARHALHVIAGAFYGRVVRSVFRKHFEFIHEYGELGPVLLRKNCIRGFCMKDLKYEKGNPASIALLHIQKICKAYLQEDDDEAPSGRRLPFDSATEFMDELAAVASRVTQHTMEVEGEHATLQRSQDSRAPKGISAIDAEHVGRKLGKQIEAREAELSYISDFLQADWRYEHCRQKIPEEFARADLMTRCGAEQPGHSIGVANRLATREALGEEAWSTYVEAALAYNEEARADFQQRQEQMEKERKSQPSSRTKIEPAAECSTKKGGVGGAAAAQNATEIKQNSAPVSAAETFEWEEADMGDGTHLAVAFEFADGSFEILLVVWVLRKPMKFVALRLPQPSSSCASSGASSSASSSSASSNANRSASAAWPAQRPTVGTQYPSPTGGPRDRYFSTDYDFTKRHAAGRYSVWSAKLQDSGAWQLVAELEATRRAKQQLAAEPVQEDQTIGHEKTTAGADLHPFDLLLQELNTPAASAQPNGAAHQPAKAAAPGAAVVGLHVVARSGVELQMQPGRAGRIAEGPPSKRQKLDGANGVTTGSSRNAVVFAEKQAGGAGGLECRGVESASASSTGHGSNYIAITDLQAKEITRARRKITEQVTGWVDKYLPGGKWRISDGTSTHTAAHELGMSLTCSAQGSTRKEYKRVVGLEIFQSFRAVTGGVRRLTYRTGDADDLQWCTLLLLAWSHMQQWLIEGAQRGVLKSNTYRADQATLALVSRDYERMLGEVTSKIAEVRGDMDEGEKMAVASYCEVPKAELVYLAPPAPAWRRETSLPHRRWDLCEGRGFWGTEPEAPGSDRLQIVPEEQDHRGHAVLWQKFATPRLLLQKSGAGCGIGGCVICVRLRVPHATHQLKAPRRGEAAVREDPDSVRFGDGARKYACENAGV